MTTWFFKMSFSVLVLTAFGLLIPQIVFCQTEKLGIVKYTPPKNWTKTEKENIVAFSEVKQTDSFCIITLYGATPGTGDAKKDFKREWDNLVVKTLNAQANPETEAVPENGWTTIAGGAPIDFNGSKAFAFLTVFSGSGRGLVAKTSKAAPVGNSASRKTSVPLR